MITRPFSHDAATGKTVLWHETDDGRVIIEQGQRVDGIVDDNRGRFREIDERAGWKGNWHRVAQIPNAIFYQLRKQGITKDRKAFKRWLNDPDNRYFRTRPGRI